jgi:hypothetical protein
LDLLAFPATESSDGLALLVVGAALQVLGVLVVRSRWHDVATQASLVRRAARPATLSLGIVLADAAAAPRPVGRALLTFVAAEEGFFVCAALMLALAAWVAALSRRVCLAVDSLFLAPRPLAHLVLLAALQIPGVRVVPSSRHDVANQAIAFAFAAGEAPPRLRIFFAVLLFSNAQGACLALGSEFRAATVRFRALFLSLNASAVGWVRTPLPGRARTASGAPIAALLWPVRCEETNGLVLIFAHFFIAAEAFGEHEVALALVLDRALFDAAGLFLDQPEVVRALAPGTASRRTDFSGVSHVVPTNALAV